jgi:ketosteroid isomerase-like protein
MRVGSRPDSVREVQPEAVLAEYGAAWERGDTERAWSFYADDVVMRLPGRGPLAGEHRGRDAVIAAIRALLDRTSTLSAEVEPLDFLTSGDRVAMLVREAVERGEERLELRRVNVYLVRDGKIAEIDIFEANQYEVDAFFR